MLAQPAVRSTLSVLSPRRGAQRGAIAVMFAVFVVLCMALMAFALDLSRMFNRKAELQGIADVAALAAASKLSGTPTGIDDAVTAASSAVASLKYQYAGKAVPWKESAISFSSSPDGSDWQSASGAKLTSGASYVKVDTSELNIGTINTVFSRAMPSKLKSVTMGTTAIAGRSFIRVTPLAVCAMKSAPAESRAPNNELVQFGFRRGVGYDLMKLNPDDDSPVSFVVNPIDPVGRLGLLKNTANDVVGPFLCTGTMPARPLVGSTVTVKRHFPIDPLYRHLNSRFAQYDGSYCHHRTAPPDTNIQQYTPANATWMKVQSPATLQTAYERKITTAPRRLETIADLDPIAANPANKFGVLWAFARPVEYSASEPKDGYKPIPESSWPGQYVPNAADGPALKNSTSYPSTTPYGSTGGQHWKASTPSTLYGKGVSQRRVLNIPLLECPVPTGDLVQAKVLAIGRFLMTVQATDSTLSVEFGGLVDEKTLTGSVELYK